MSRNAAPLNGGLARAREPAADRREVWDNVLRLTASVRTGTVSASLMLKRLGASHGKTGWRWPCAKRPDRARLVHVRLAGKSGTAAAGD
jgi:Tn3 transposase DDE domain